MRFEVLIIKLYRLHSVLQHQLELLVLLKCGRTVRVHDVIARVEGLERMDK